MPDGGKRLRPSSPLNEPFSLGLGSVRYARGTQPESACPRAREPAIATSVGCENGASRSLTNRRQTASRPLGDDIDGAVDHFDGGLVVNCVTRSRWSSAWNGPAPRDPDAGTAGRVRPGRDHVTVLEPGQTTLSHAESNEEAFLVLSGDCALIVEDEERRRDPGTSSTRLLGPSTPSRAWANAVFDAGSVALGPGSSSSPIRTKGWRRATDQLPRQETAGKR